MPALHHYVFAPQESLLTTGHCWGQSVTGLPTLEPEVRAGSTGVVPGPGAKLFGIESQETSHGSAHCYIIPAVQLARKSQWAIGEDGVRAT